MSKIDFPFAKMTKIFADIIDLSKPRYHKHLVFAFWSISKTFTIPFKHNGQDYDAYELSCTYEEIASALGISIKVAKGIVKFFNRIGWLIKIPNKIKNRANRFKWDEERFKAEKIVSLQENAEKEDEKRADQNLKKEAVHNSTKGPTVYREENDKKGPTENEINRPTENEEKGRPTQKRADQRADRFTSENTQKRADQRAPSIETIESLCLKETKENKEKVAALDRVGDLSLSHEEKNLFASSRQNELAEHQQALEAYVSYRNIPNITSKTIGRWLMTYPIDEIKEALGMVLSNGNVQIQNPGGWIENALQKGIVRQERAKQQNIEFAKQMTAKNKHLILNSRYCRDKRFEDREFYYHIDPQVFQSELRKCL